MVCVRRCGWCGMSKEVRVLCVRRCGWCGMCKEVWVVCKEMYVLWWMFRRIRLKLHILSVSCFDCMLPQMLCVCVCVARLNLSIVFFSLYDSLISYCLIFSFWLVFTHAFKLNVLFFLSNATKVLYFLVLFVL